MIPQFPPMLQTSLTWVKCLLVAISESSEFLLASSVPHVELDGAVVGVENHRVDLYSNGSDVLLLVLSSQVALHKGSLADSTVSNENQLVLCQWLSLAFHLYSRD